MKRVLKIRYLIWVVLFVLVVWALGNIPFTQIGDTLRTLQFSDIAILLVINIFIFLSFSSRWWLITRAQGYNPPFLPLVGYRLAAFGISYFTPGTQFGGEPLQVYMLERERRIPNSSALASVSLDKLVELLANFTFLLIGMILVLNGGLLPALGNPAAMTVVVALLAAPLLYLIALWIGRNPLTSAFSRLPNWFYKKSKLGDLPPLICETEGQIGNLLKTSPWTVLWIVMISGSIWVMMLVEYWLALRFLGAQISLAGAVIALTAARLAFLTPLPGGVGALEASQVLALGALGYSPAIGISISVLIRARDILFGLSGLWWGAHLTRRGGPAPALIHPANAGELAHVPASWVSTPPEYANQSPLTDDIS